MTFIEAAAEVLRQAGKPLHYKEITELAIARNLLSHVGKTPEVTMGHRLTSAIKKDDKEVPIVKVKPGIFALREWEGRKGKAAVGASAEPDSAERIEDAADESDQDEADVEVNALEIEAALRATDGAPGAGRRGQRSVDRDEVAAESAEDEGFKDAQGERETPVSGDEVLRADLAASGADLFDDEEDDDQPILGRPPAPGVQPAQQQGEGGRRRRRRRRRGRGGQGADAAVGGGTAGTSDPRFLGPRPGDSSQPRIEGAIQPTPIITLDGEGSPEPFAAPRPVVRDRQQIMAGGQPTGIELPLADGDELSGRELADAAAIILSSFDRNAGAVPVRSVGETLARRGRLQGDPVLVSAQVGASMRADNLRRAASAQRPRFRFATGGRVALSDWTVGGELPRLEQEVISAVERYREVSRRALLRRLQELPGHALIELLLVAFERVGMTGIRVVRRAGSPGGEAHFAAVHKTAGEALPTAIVVRKDGREIGRERVTDLRGALHHYGPATVGWLVTTGQILSGAREEAGSAGTPPVMLYDGIALCKLLEEFDVGTLTTRFNISIPDLELLEALRG